MVNNETLEKMEYLHSCGFEPDLAYVTHICGTSESSWEDWGLVSWYPDCKNPYFTESKLWSLLPNYIQIEEHISRENSFTHDDRDVLIEHELDINIDEICYKDEDGNQESVIRICDIGLHTALLDLTIWAVKEGHLKAEGKPIEP